MISATVTVRVSDQSIARSMIRSTRPDNFRMKGLVATARATPRNATFHISYNGRIETFISTLEDLLRCVQAAEGTLRKIDLKTRK